jgi:hypothetical protein
MSEILQEGNMDEPKEKVEKKNGFWLDFCRRMSSRRFWIFIISTIFAGVVMFTPILKMFDPQIQIICFIFTLSVWALVILLYYGDDIIVNGLGEMIANAKIAAEFKAIAQKTINTDTAKVIEAAKGGEK